jgi:hypothetical protein
VVRVQPKPLWQFVLDGYREIPDGTGGYFDRLHPFDATFVIWHLQDLRDLGEEPTVDEFRRHLRSVRRDFGDAEREVLDIWKRLLRNPDHRFRILRERQTEWNPQPYESAARIIERDRLLLSVADRIEGALHQRINSLVAAADQGTRGDFDRAYTYIRSSMRAVRRLRRMRFGVELEDE